jgi:hypothetical protein
MSGRTKIFPHRTGHVPRDGLHLLWQKAIGTVHSRKFALARQKLDDETFRVWVALNEVVPLGKLSPLTAKYIPTAMAEKLRVIDVGMGYGPALEGISAIGCARGRT